MWKVVRRERDVQAQLDLATGIANSLDDQMKQFLQSCLANPEYGVYRCFVFGSVIGKYPTRDVDVIVQFNSFKESQIRLYRGRLRKVESSFHEFYKLKLHLQTFVSIENDELDGFLNDTGLYEQIL